MDGARHMAWVKALARLGAILFGLGWFALGGVLAFDVIRDAEADSLALKGAITANLLAFMVSGATMAGWLARKIDRDHS